MWRKIKMAFGNLSSIIPGGTKKEGADYKSMYEALEKKCKTIASERDAALSLIRKLGYELGEDPNPLKEASFIKGHCKKQTSCERCYFNSKNGCILNGASPFEWRIR